MFFSPKKISKDVLFSFLVSRVGVGVVFALVTLEAY